MTDNSGAKEAQVINQSGKSWGIGDIVTVAIKRSQPRSKVAAGSVSLRGGEGARLTRNKRVSRPAQALAGPMRGMLGRLCVWLVVRGVRGGMEEAPGHGRPFHLGPPPPLSLSTRSL